MNAQEKCLSYIAGTWYQSTGNLFQSWDPVVNQAIDSCTSSTLSDVNQALQAAQAASQTLQLKSGADIARFLQTLADEIETLGDELITTAMQETGLPQARLQGERARTCGQIRAFAALAEEGRWVQASIDTADPERSPLPKPDVRAVLGPIGPVVVFGASNFPFAFGSVGGDTASALAAGNPVVVKGHPSHPATSTLFARAVDSAVNQCDFPAGSFSLIQGPGHELGMALVEHPLTKAVGFTGSLRGGRALMDAAARRPKPIPVYAEMGSINPVFIMPDALANRADAIASGLAASIAMGAGQFCTSPGLVVTLAGDFTDQLTNQLADQDRGFMLNPGIANALASQVGERSQDDQVTVLTGGADANNPLQPKNTLMKVSAQHFMKTPALAEEVFGPVSLVVECDSVTQMQAVAEQLEGNLTATIHTDDYDTPATRQLLNTLSAIAGRVLFNGYPTGVEVCPSMQHGGPYPASSAPATTSVGTAAINRFTQRHAYQNCPDSLLPAALQNANPLNIWRQLNGGFTQAPAA